MIDLLQLTNDPVFARRCDELDGMRLFVDLERLGKAERQAGMNTFISTHQMDDVGIIKAVLKRSRLMVRVNPLNPASAAEVTEVLAQGADMVMLPMFGSAEQLQGFSEIVAGRAPIVALLETADALDTLEEWIATPGLAEVFVGLNDLHLSLGHRFMFEPLTRGHVERVARTVARQGLRFGFGGIARLNEGMVPGRSVLAEHVRLGSRAVILSRTFHQHGQALPFEEAVGELRDSECQLRLRNAAQVEADRLRLLSQVAEVVALRGSQP